MLRLEFPDESHSEMYKDMIQEWKSMEETPTSPSLLFRGVNYDDFLQIIQRAQKGEIKNNTPSSLFFLLDGNNILGAIDIRHSIDHPNLRNFGGHIGYGIRPGDRRKGYATEILRLGLQEAKKLRINKVLISCHPENIASEKVILNNGGVHESTVESKGRIYKRHWITL